jgi:hypothetical protein
MIRDEAAPAGSVGDPFASGQLAVPRGWRPQGSAQALLGWLPREQGESLLARQADGELSEAQRIRVRAARDAVAARPAGLDQADLISPPPGMLAEHVTRLGSTPAGGWMHAEGWEIALVDLSRVVAIRPSVFLDTAVERTAHLDPGDLRAAAELTLPVSHSRPIGELAPGDDAPPISVQYHCRSRTFTITAPNLDLTLAGSFNAPGNAGAPQPGGLLGFGFNITVPPSFLQVARCQDRYVLQDGYHRALGLLSRRITRAPAYVRDVDIAELALAEALPRSVWLGDRPPLLRDYLDDLVAEAVLLPVPCRVIVIQATELLLAN